MGRREHVTSSRDRNQASTSQGTQWILGYYPKLGESWFLKGTNPVHILISDFWPPELQNNQFLLFLSHPVYGNLLQQPQGTNTLIFFLNSTVISGESISGEKRGQIIPLGDLYHTEGNIISEEDLTPPKIKNKSW
jgi:hypothetical protein